LANNETAYITEIDLSSAYDTVYRGSLLDGLKSNNLGTEYDRSIVDFLLSNTKLIVRINGQFGV